MLIQIFTLFSLVISVVLSQGVSPCPDILSYEPRKTEEPDRWYGVLSLKTTEDLEGVWIKIILDRSVELLGNWFGETRSSDNKEFSIRNPKYRLEAGPPVSVRFFVKYNAATIVPTVTKILLNGKVICPPTEPKLRPTLHTSAPEPGTRPTTPSTPIRSSSIKPISRPLGPNNGLNLETDDDDDDDDNSGIFAGDFALRPTKKPASRPAGIQNKSPSCGTVAARASPLISYGQNTTPGQWPWHAALYHSRGLQLTYNCGGTLISESHILTAAHCVTRTRSNTPVNKRYLLVYLGKYNLLTFGADVQGRNVDQIYVHPQYNHTVYFNDIAILKLSSPAEINNNVRPCCLWDDTTDSNIIGQLGTVVGWGFDENGELSKTLMQTQMPVVSTVDCIYSNRNFFSQFAFQNNYCAGFQNATSVCNGDSGGGMVFPKPGTRNSVWQIRGIVSVGVALQGHGVCDTSHYVLFTDAAKYLEWIKEIITL